MKMLPPVVRYDARRVTDAEMSWPSAPLDRCGTGEVPGVREAGHHDDVA
jgi:hypothetical protein